MKFNDATPEQRQQLEHRLRHICEAAKHGDRRANEILCSIQHEVIRTCDIEYEYLKRETEKYIST